MPRHFFIAGAQRCATTYLYRILDQHPDIAMARPMRPEPKYFIRPGPAGSVAGYRDEFFPSAATPWLGEKSTSYIERPLAAARIARLLPDAEVFFVLRDPVERALSNYRFSVINGLETLALEDALDAEEERCGAAFEGTSVSPFAYVGRGLYASQLDAWAAIFPRRQMHVLTTEQLVGDTRATLDRLFAVLQVDPSVPLAGIDEPVNSSGPMPDAPERVLERLRVAFADSNADLARRYDVATGDWR